jgi:hypothetical protein
VVAAVVNGVPTHTLVFNPLQAGAAVCGGGIAGHVVFSKLRNRLSSSNLRTRDLCSAVASSGVWLYNVPFLKAVLKLILDQSVDVWVIHVKDKLATRE